MGLLNLVWTGLKGLGKLLILPIVAIRERPGFPCGCCGACTSCSSRSPWAGWVGLGTGWGWMATWPRTPNSCGDLAAAAVSVDLRRRLGRLVAGAATAGARRTGRSSRPRRGLARCPAGPRPRRHRSGVNAALFGAGQAIRAGAHLLSGRTDAAGRGSNGLGRAAAAGVCPARRRVCLYERRFAPCGNGAAARGRASAPARCGACSAGSDGLCTSTGPGHRGRTRFRPGGLALGRHGLGRVAGDPARDSRPGAAARSAAVLDDLESLTQAARDEFSGRAATVAVTEQLHADEVQRQVARLDYVCRLIAHSRSPYCPLNGVLVLLPYAGFASDAKAAQCDAALGQDLHTVAEATRVACPVVGVVCDLELHQEDSSSWSGFPPSSASAAWACSFRWRITSTSGHCVKTSSWPRAGRWSTWRLA